MLLPAGGMGGCLPTVMLIMLVVLTSGCDAHVVGGHCGGGAPEHHLLLHRHAHSGTLLHTRGGAATIE